MKIGNVWNLGKIRYLSKIGKKKEEKLGICKKEKKIEIYMQYEEKE